MNKVHSYSAVTIGEYAKARLVPTYKPREWTKEEMLAYQAQLGPRFAATAGNKNAARSRKRRRDIATGAISKDRFRHPWTLDLSCNLRTDGKEYLSGRKREVGG